MGLIGRTLFEGRAKGGYGPHHDYWYAPVASETAAGVEVNEGTALNYSAVYNAVTLIAGTIGSLPLILYQRLKRGKTRAINHRLYDIVHTVPNFEMTAMTWEETSMAHVLTWGNWYSEITRNARGEVAQLWPISPNRVKVKRENGRLFYDVKVGTETKTFPREKILHVPGLGFDGLIGYSVITKARESIALGLAGEKCGAKLFGQGLRPSGVLEHPGPGGLGPETIQNLRESITNQVGGLDNIHRLLILEEGFTWKQLGINPEDAQFLQTRLFQIPEIARWFNLPPHKLKDMTKSSFSNIEQEQISFVVDSIRPWCVRIEQCMDMQLLTPEERRQGYFHEHLLEGLLRGDSAARADFYNKLFQTGSISPNDIREKENMNPVDGGDETYIPLNMIPTSQAGMPQNEEDQEEVKALLESVGLEQRKRQTIEVRNRLKKTWEPLFVDAIQRVVNKESKAVAGAAKKYLTERNLSIFQDRLDELYESMPDYIERLTFPVFRGYADAVQEAASAEIGIEPGMTHALEKFTKEYQAVYATQHIASSQGQLQAIMRDAPPKELAETITTRTDGWMEGRAGKNARRQVVEAQMATVGEVWKAGGRTKWTWFAQGKKPCPFCQNLNGKTMGITQNFVDKGETLNPEGADAGMVIKGPKRHAPLHGGCECTVTAG